MWVEVGEESECHHNTLYEILKELTKNKYWRNEAALSPWYLSVWKSSHLSSSFSSDVAFLCDSCFWSGWLQSTISQTRSKVTGQASVPAAPSAGLLPQMSVSHKSLIWITYCGSPYPQVVTNPEFKPECRAGFYSQRWWQADECET